MRIVVIDAQGGRIGKQLISAIRKELPQLDITAVGTNGAATAAMLSAGPDRAATGENAVAVACRTADVILGPVGVAIADSMLGEVTPAMALAVGQSRARRILIPFDNCDTVIVGASEAPVGRRVQAAVDALRDSL